MKYYQGVIIEESLTDKQVLEKIKITSTRIEKVTKKHATPWLKRWTLLTVEIPESEANKIASEIARAIDNDHINSWYADFKNDTNHYIVFKNKVYYINRHDKKEYEYAKKYGLAKGIPEHQLISPDTAGYID